MSVPALAIVMQLVVAQPDPASVPSVPPLAPEVAVSVLPMEDQNVPPSVAPAEPGDALVTQPPLEGPASPTLPPDLLEPEDDLVVTARPGAPPGDPLQGLNVTSFTVVQAVDEAVTAPVALAYKRAVPSPVRSGLRNFLSNLQEPIVSLNYLLQFKPGKSAETLGRFAINSTIGVGGLIDVAKTRPFKLPRRTNGFAYTLGYHGVKPGPYLYLPLIGPTTVRDLVGRLGDLSVLPVAVGAPFNQAAFTIPTTSVRLLDERAEAEDGMRTLLEGTADPYSTIREDYLSRRQAEIDALRAKQPDKDRSSVPDPAPDQATNPSPL